MNETLEATLFFSNEAEIEEFLEWPLISEAYKWQDELAEAEG